MPFRHKSSFLLYRFSVKKLPAEPVCCRIASASSLKKVNSMLCYVWFANQHKTQGVYGMNDNLSHTSWKCKYHIVFAPKYRRKSIYGTLKNFKAIVRVEKSRDTRSGGLSRSYPHVGQYTAEYKCISIHGIFEGKKFSDDL